MGGGRADRAGTVISALLSSCVLRYRKGMIQILGLSGIGEVTPGTDLPALLHDILARAAPERPRNALLVVTQKVVSKAEGRFVALNTVSPGPEAMRLAQLTDKDPRLVELVLRESSDVVRAARNVLITRHRLGLVMANAGIDRSNLGPDGAGEERVLLLPVDPDASAARIAARVGMPVVVSDSFGRPWRHGVTSVAIGAAGLPALVDRRGELDRDGRRLEVTQVALGDILATAASLAAGEGAEGVPAVLIGGVRWDTPARPAADLVRPLEEDLFR